MTLMLKRLSLCLGLQATVEHRISDRHATHPLNPKTFRQVAAGAIGDPKPKVQ